ncbi:MAG: hypothetical protein AAF993_10025 [Pseudomonadota bacterium]
MRHFCYRPAYAVCVTTPSAHRWPRRRSAGAWSNNSYETRQYGGHHSRSGDFGVRRPLRYLRYHLDLDDSQSRRMAAVLNRLKLEREQTQIDEKRSVQKVAALLLEDDTQLEELKTALHPRVKSAEHLQSEVAQALQEVMTVLDADQRTRFADMIATGAFTL